ALAWRAGFRRVREVVAGTARGTLAGELGRRRGRGQRVVAPGPAEPEMQERRVLAVAGCHERALRALQDEHGIARLEVGQLGLLAVAADCRVGGNRERDGLVGGGLGALADRELVPGERGEAAPASRDRVKAAFGVGN